MIAESTFFKPIFWIAMGLLYALIMAGAPIWAQDLGLHMTWWKWCLTAIWYVLLSFSFAGGFTLLGEREQGAWYRFMGFHLIITLVLGAVMWTLL
jgi:hypothetical protein